MTTPSPHDRPVDWSTRSIPLGPPAAPLHAHTAATIPYPAPARGRRPLGMVGWLLIAAAVLLIGGGVTAGALVYLGKVPIAIPGVSRFTAHGSITVVDCSSPGYSDIRDGTQVVLTDEAGKVLSVGQLSPAGTVCMWDFTLPDVPAGGKFYGITISHRGTLQYTEQQLRAGVELQLGGG